MAEKKIALITGANKGIGLETARQLGKLNYTVLLGARDLAKGEDAAQKLRQEGVDVRAVKLEITSQSDVDALAKLVDSDFGGTLDVLINNAGISTDNTWGAKGTSGTTLEELKQTFDTNLFATFAVTKSLLPALKKADAARIVNVSSILASLTLHATEGSPIYSSKSFAYDASKSALNAFTIHLAYELRDTKIKVNSSHPGWVKTDMGGDRAPMDIPEGAKTQVQLATLDENGPTGGFFHQGEALPW